MLSQFSIVSHLFYPKPAYHYDCHDEEVFSLFHGLAGDSDQCERERVWEMKRIILRDSPLIIFCLTLTRLHTFSVRVTFGEKKRELMISMQAALDVIVQEHFRE